MCLECETLAEQLRRERNRVAHYRHQDRVRRGKARRNTRYRGRPTKFVQQSLPTPLANLIAQRPEILKILQSALE